MSNAEILKATQLNINQSHIELASRDSLPTIRTKNDSMNTHVLLIKQSYLMSMIMFVAFYLNFMLFPLMTSQQLFYLFYQFMLFDALSKEN